MRRLLQELHRFSLHLPQYVLTFESDGKTPLRLDQLVAEASQENEFITWYHPTYLVGGIPTPLKNMKVSWDDYSQYMGK